MKLGKKMKVSVLILAYNHEPYIEQAVWSAVIQRTNFDYEIVVGEDFSTDRTLEILYQMKEKYPEKIRLLTTDHNLGMAQNYIRTLQACDGEYIALLDGDDYWCAENKLQQQVEFLDQNPDFSIVFHGVLRVYEDGSQQSKEVYPPGGRDVFDIDDLIRSNFIPTCSILFRNGLIGEFPDWAFSMNMLDWPTFILVAKHGKIKLLDRLMAVHRVHSSGVWSSMNMIKRLLADISFYEKLNPYFDYRYTETIQANLDRNWKRLMNEYYDQAVTLGSTKAGLNFAQEAWVSLKDHDSFPPKWKKELSQRIYSHYLYTSFESGNYPEAWAAWLGMMLNNPRLLLNRGLLLLGMEASFNGRWRYQIQKFSRVHRQKK
jgi:glycosyltransferase involved in cell wall biosynthesis